MGLIKVGKLSYNPVPIGEGQGGTQIFNGFFKPKKFSGKKRPVAVKKILINKMAAQSVQNEVEVMKKACSKRSHPNILGYFYTKRTDDFL